MKIFNLQKGHLFIENSSGAMVSFNDAAEYSKYTGKVMPNVFCVSYEPDRDINVEFDGVNTVVIEGNNPSYDEDIAKVLTYQLRKADPYYGMSTEETLAASKSLKRSEILDRYRVEENLLEYTAGGSSYAANIQHIMEIFVDYELAGRNSETQVLIFDVDNEPHMIAIAQVEPALQGMRALAKDLRIKGRGYLTDVSNATTLEEVEAIVWVG